MTQNQKPTNSILCKAMRMGILTCLLLTTAALLNGQVTNIQTAATATQGILSYTAPGSGACTVQVREGKAQSPLVHDIDPALFPGSNLDSRSGNVTTGLKRVFVVGKRAAESALDGRRYSRALQTLTTHVFTITSSSYRAGER